MTVLIVATGDTAEYNASYCARLIEQGVAIPVQKERKRGKRQRSEVIGNVTEDENS